MDLVLQAANERCNLAPGVLRLGASINERERGVIIMLCGTAGTGKSTLASLIAQRFGITTVLSTDSLRHGLRCALHYVHPPWPPHCERALHPGRLCCDPAQRFREAPR